MMCATSQVKGVHVEYEVVIKFYIKAKDSEDAKNTADAISNVVYRYHGIDSDTKEIIELD